MASQTLAEKTEALANKATKKAKEEPKQLPIWAEEIRSAPNEVIRSSLFSARVRGQREYLTDEVVFVLGDGEITYRGEELRTFDEDVWLQVMHLARLQPLGECVQFTPYAMVKALGWVKGNTRPSKVHYQRLEECLSRLSATTIKVKSKRIEKFIGVSLIRKFENEDRDESWKVWIEPEMKALYGDTYYTQLEWEQRTHLTPIGKRLHSYFASHQAPYPVKIESLYQLCNIQTAIKHFRAKLEDYLTELVEIKFLESFSIEEGKVLVKRVS